jgi:hypothetical protein
MATTKKLPQGEDNKMSTPAVPRVAEPEPIPPTPEPVPVAPAVVTPAATVVTDNVQLNEDELRRVNTIKEKFTDVVGYLKVLRDSYHDADIQRCLSVAITEAETASMWAVKAVTWRG